MLCHIPWNFFVLNIQRLERNLVLNFNLFLYSLDADLLSDVDFLFLTVDGGSSPQIPAV